MAAHVKPLPEESDDTSTRMRLSDLGFIGIASAVGFIALVVGLVVLLIGYARLPTTAHLESDLWAQWVKQHQVDGHTLADLVSDNRWDAAKQLLADFGRKSNQPNRERLSLDADIGSIQLRGEAVTIDAYQPANISAAEIIKWRTTIVPFQDRYGRTWELTVEYHFRQNLEDLPSYGGVRHLALWRRIAFVVIGVLAVVLLAGAVITARHHRQIRLDLRRLAAFRRQLAHEMGNALGTFQGNAQAVAQLLAVVDRLAERFGPACVDAAKDAGLDEAAARKVAREIERRLQRNRAGVEHDLPEAAADARVFHDRFDPSLKFFSDTMLRLSASLKSADFAEPQASFTLSEVWDEVTRLLEPSFRKKQATHTEETLGAPAPVFGYRLWMLQALFNLCKNSLESMRTWDGPQIITFRCWQDGNEVVCTVHNPGPPIPPEVRPQLFGTEISTKGEAGRGRGLLVVAEAVRQNGGRVQLLQSDDTGTEFEIRLPAADPANSPPVPSESPDRSAES